MGWEREEMEDGEREDRGESTREVWRVAQEEDQCIVRCARCVRCVWCAGCRVLGIVCRVLCAGCSELCTIHRTISAHVLHIPPSLLSPLSALRSPPSSLRPSSPAPLPPQTPETQLRVERLLTYYCKRRGIKYVEEDLSVVNPS